MFRLLNPDGTVRDRLPVTLDEMKELYADMVEARAFDTKSMALQRQGRLATYAPYRGQEAAQVGAAAAMEAGEPGGAPVMYFHGYPGSRLEARLAAGGARNSPSKGNTSRAIAAAPVGFVEEGGYIWAATCPMANATDPSGRRTTTEP